jgi:hypothetical protein
VKDDAAFLDDLADALFDLPGVEAVALGGSRVYGDPGPSPDRDLSVYYRDGFDPADVRALARLAAGGLSYAVGGPLLDLPGTRTLLSGGGFAGAVVAIVIVRQLAQVIR